MGENTGKKNMVISLFSEENFKSTILTRVRKKIDTNFSLCWRNVFYEGMGTHHPRIYPLVGMWRRGTGLWGGKRREGLPLPAAAGKKTGIYRWIRWETSVVAHYFIMGFKRWGFEWFSRGGFRSGRMRKTRFYDWTMAMMMSNWTFIMISDRILLPILWFLRRLSSRESGFELCGILYWFAFRWSIFDFWALIRHLERGEHFIHESSLTMAATIESDKNAEYLQFLEQFSDSLFSTLLN